MRFNHFSGRLIVPEDAHQGNTKVLCGFYQGRAVDSGDKSCCVWGQDHSNEVSASFCSVLDVFWSAASANFDLGHGDLSRKAA